MLSKSNLNNDIWISNFIGIEFKEVGRGKLCDCWGLVRKVFSDQYNIEIPRYDQYETTKELEKINLLIEKKTLENKWHNISKGNEKKGDVILFKIRGFLCHVGFCLENGYMLHIQKGKNACIENYLGLRWKNRIHSFYRHENLNER